MVWSKNGVSESIKKFFWLKCVFGFKDGAQSVGVVQSEDVIQSRAGFIKQHGSVKNFLV